MALWPSERRSAAASPIGLILGAAVGGVGLGTAVSVFYPDDPGALRDGGIAVIAACGGIALIISLLVIAGKARRRHPRAPPGIDHEPHFRDLVEGSIEGILIHRQLKPLFANPTFAAILGYQRAEDILALASLAPHIAAMERARIQPPAALPPAGTAPLQYEFDAVRQDGETITLRGVTRRIDWDGEPAWQTTVIDVTEQRCAERRLRQRQFELARMTQVSAVAETAGQLAHELNQPLTAIMLYGDSILELVGGPPALPAALAPLLQQTAAQAQRAGEILNNLRTFLRQRAVDKTWTDLNALAESAVELIAADARAHGVAVRLAPADSLPLLWLDPLQLEHVLANLLHNSIDSLVEAGSPVRQLTLRTQPAPGGKVQVTVQDTGPPLAERAAVRLLEAVYARPEDSVGLRLAISRSVIEAYGGRLWVEASANGGAAFHFTLPVTAE